MKKALSILFLFYFLQAVYGADSKPNVLLIVCDDLNDYISGMNSHPQAKTPNIEKLASSGVMFRRAYSNNPVCAPSRSSFLSGLYPHTSYNFFWSKWFENPIMKNSNTLMEYFKKQGYSVLGTGKLMHHFKKEVWSEYKNKTDYGPYWFNGKDRTAHPNVPKPMYDVGPIDGSFASFDDQPKQKGPKDGWVLGWGSPKLYDYSEGSSDLTPDERNAQWASQKLQEFADNQHEDPFFLAVGFVRPHTPLHVRQKYFDLFPEDEVLLPVLKEGDNEDTFYHKILKRKGHENKGGTYYQNLKEGYEGKHEGLKKFTRAYLASVAAVDANVGKVIDTLDNTHLKDNTIVVFTSDHGWNMGQKEHLFKGAPWEESCRVPFVVRAPGVTKQGGIAEHPISLIDLYPTLTDLCGISGDTRKNEKGIQIDGTSVRPFLENPKSREWEGPRIAVTMVFDQQFDGNPHKQNWSLRSEDFRYIKYSDGTEELYDHRSDSHEWMNLAMNPEYDLIKNRIYQELLSMLPTPEEVTQRSASMKKGKEKNAEKWKNEYFKKNPASDLNKDGKLSWSEFQEYKKGKK